MTTPPRKSQLLNLSFPYDWSSASISDEALILNVLERGIYDNFAHASPGQQYRKKWTTRRPAH